MKRMAVMLGLALALVAPPSLRADDVAPIAIGGLVAALGSTDATGVHGSVAIEPINGELIQVTLYVVGLPANATQVDHMHRGSCQEPGPIAYPLTPLSADENGVAQSITALRVPLGTLLSDRYYVDVHGGADDESPGVACANLTTGVGG